MKKSKHDTTFRLAIAVLKNVKKCIGISVSVISCTVLNAQQPYYWLNHFDFAGEFMTDDLGQLNKLNRTLKKYYDLETYRIWDINNGVFITSPNYCFLSKNSVGFSNHIINSRLKRSNFFQNVSPKTDLKRKKKFESILNFTTVNRSENVNPSIGKPNFYLNQIDLKFDLRFYNFHKKQLQFDLIVKSKSKKGGIVIASKGLFFLQLEKTINRKTNLLLLDDLFIFNKPIVANGLTHGFSKFCTSYSNQT